MPSTTGSVSRARPIRRATISAREGSPRRAGSVADMSTPMNVPCMASRRLARRQVGAAARMACQAMARANMAAHISASPAATRPGLEASSEAATRVDADALQRERGQPGGSERADGEAGAAQGAQCAAAAPASGRRGPAAARAAARRGRAAAGRRARGRSARRRGRRSRRPERRRAMRLLIAVEHFGGHVRPGEALGALARGERHARAQAWIERERAQRLGKRERVAGRHEQPVEHRHAGRRGSRGCRRRPRAWRRRTPR